MSPIKEVEHIRVSLREIFASKNVIGSGGFGTVYLGVLSQDPVAVKRLDRDYGQGEKEFNKEIRMLSSFRHANLVSLIGFCDEKHEILPCNDIPWSKRLQICLDTARGLKYLHHDVGSEHRILHSDIKRSNIILDENWNAKISDFGISKIVRANVDFSFPVTKTCGTKGYVDPLYEETGILSKESDIYSFAVVLFEVLQGKLAWAEINQSEHRSLVKEAIDLHIHLQNILLATDDFASENVIGSGGFGKVYRRILSQVPVAVKRLDRDYGQGEKEFNMEIRMLSSYRHANLISLIGFCEEKDEKILMYKYAKYESHLSCSEPILLGAARGLECLHHDVWKLHLSWSERLQILLGAARGLEYLHHVGSERRFLHRDIKSSNILLDENWNPYKYRISTLPHDVGYQDGCVGEALAKLESLIRDNTNNQSTQIIVETISHGLCSKRSSVAEDLIGMELPLNEIKSMLKIGSGGVCFVGICGVAGIGKTTLASEIYKEISSEFEYSSFVKDVNEISCKSGIKLVQEKILGDILKDKYPRLVGVEECGYMMKSRLCRKRVLIILDDIWEIEELNALAGSKDWFGEGSRIIITSRHQNKLMAHGVTVIYEVKVLNEEQSLQLFNKHASGVNTPMETYETLLYHVVHYAAGLPMLLKLLGSFLRGKDMEEWNSALAKLRDYDQRWGIPGLSYDGLRQDQKEMLLDIACFLRGKEVDSVVRMLDACGYCQVRTSLKELTQKCLITIWDGTVDMHDIILAMCMEQITNNNTSTGILAEDGETDECLGDLHHEMGLLQAGEAGSGSNGFNFVFLNLVHGLFKCFGGTQ